MNYQYTVLFIKQRDADEDIKYYIGKQNERLGVLSRLTIRVGPAGCSTSPEDFVCPTLQNIVLYT